MDDNPPAYTDIQNANGMQDEEGENKRPFNNPIIAQPRSANTTYVDPIDPTCLNLCCDINSYNCFLCCYACCSDSHHDHSGCGDCDCNCGDCNCCDNCGDCGSCDCGSCDCDLGGCDCSGC